MSKMDMIEISEFKIGEVVEILVKPTWFQQKWAKFKKKSAEPCYIIGKVEYLSNKEVTLIAWYEINRVKDSKSNDIRYGNPVGGSVRIKDIIKLKKYKEVI